MPPLKSNVRLPAGGGATFPNTHWSLVLRAGGTVGEARPALEHLCQAYWRPLYAFVRSRGFSAHDAEDLTQSFLLTIIDDQLLGRADPELGRFRSFVLGALRNFLANAHRREQAQRRGGEIEFLSLDQARDDGYQGLEPVDNATAEVAFERHWAQALLDRVFTRLRGEYEAAERPTLFVAIEPYLTGKVGQTDYATVGQELGLSSNAVAISVHRLRRRYGELLRNEIAMTVATPEEVEDEVAHLLAVISRKG